MPCKDTTAQISIILDEKDCMVSFNYSKLTCQKAVGGGTGFINICRGKPVSDIVELEFSDLVVELGLTESEEQFLLYMEWDALGAALAQYQGDGQDVDKDRYQIATIAYESDQVEIRQLVASPEEMPKLVACRKRV
jgi:hypothetical protein